MGNEQSAIAPLSEEERARCFQSGYDAADEFFRANKNTFDHHHKENKAQTPQVCITDNLRAEKNVVDARLQQGSAWHELEDKAASPDFANLAESAGFSENHESEGEATRVQEKMTSPLSAEEAIEDHLNTTSITSCQTPFRLEETISKPGTRVGEMMCQALPEYRSLDLLDTKSPEAKDPLAGWEARKEKHAQNSRNDDQNGSPSTAMEDQSRKYQESQGAQDNAATPVKRRLESALGDERRDNDFKIPKRSQISKLDSSARQSTIAPNSNDERVPPAWYMEEKKRVVRGKNDGSGNVDVLLASLRDTVRRCKSAHTNGALLKMQFQALREKLHSASFTEVNPKLLKGNRTLDNEVGLPQLFDMRYAGGISWPYDIESDAEELYNKWCAGNFDVNLLHGIVVAKKDVAGGAKAIRPISSKYAGKGRLLNGQWWPILLCAFRDGAHGEIIKGISGEKDKGAYSCFISGGGGGADNYPDIDDGDVVRYCGTDDVTGSGKITGSTQLMLDSFTNRISVRFIRSSKAQEKSRWAPEYGFRYDGLYDVTDYEILDPAKQRHRFTLVRCPGQDPIRGGNGPESRPTKQEIKAYLEDKRMRGF